MMTKLYVTLLTCLLTGGMLWSQQPQPAVFQSNGAAIKGYDAVAYHLEGKAQPGNQAYSVTWNNATWLFATEKNKEAFAKNPEKYAPQYGGYCAFGASRNYKAPTDPNAWTVVDGKLYLNYSAKVKEGWLPEKEKHIAKADSNWIKLEKQ
ncbi:MAG: YHS domain-containing protein [Chitinophagaceae bacterium]|nr:YHS domain-containing protein [Chitinophagaceae bacterium]